MQLKAKSALLALVAVFAVSAVSTAAASATTPEFKPVPTKNKFTGTSGSVEWTFGSEAMTCSNMTLSGSVTSARTIGKLAIVFTGCRTAGATKKGCAVNSAGAKEGEIVADALDGELGTIATKEAPSGVGILVEPESGKTWTLLVGNECTKETKLTGAIALEVATIGKKQTTNKLVIATKSVEEITLDSGKKEEVVGFTAWGTVMNLRAQSEVKFEEALEVT